MASKIARKSLAISSRCYGTAVPLPSQEETLKVSKSTTGATVVTVDSNSPLAAVSVFFKAGARYNSFPGASMALEHLVTGGKNTAEHIGEKYVRAREHSGISFDVHVGRELLSYTCVGRKDAVQVHLGQLATATSSTSYITYLPHTYITPLDKARLDLSLDVHPVVLVRDLLYKAAFRGHPLGNSAYLPPRLTSKLSLDMVVDFMKKTHGKSGMTVVGSGVDHFQLLESVSDLGMEEGGVAHSAQPAKYFGGDERIEIGGGLATVIVAGEGAAFGTPESAAAKVASTLLSTGSVGLVAPTTGLARAAKGVPFISVEGLSEGCEDSGLLGFQVVAAATEAPQLVTNLTAALKGYTVTEADFAAAKAKAKAAILHQTQLANLSVIGQHSVIKGEVKDLADAVKAVDAVSLGAVQAALKKAFGGKLTVAAVGNVNNVPYSDTM